ncbi:MAG: aminotransferase class I/II-fold pyridoxal phosphate-dependent enzyme [Nitrospinae bacterium]|nr:aminotransferase class I/II-fold pyridoxal phosphate-dependent enzyme [Nitrospinota bacterium]
MIKNDQHLTNSPYPEHGGNAQAMAKKAGIDLESILDFSASINPLGPPPCVSQLLMETPRLLNEYPDPDHTNIKKLIASSENVPENWISVTNGSTELIYLLPFLVSPEHEILVVDPLFSEYEKSFSRFNIKVHSHTLSSEHGFQIQIPELFQQLESIDNLGAVIIGHPNSPTGNLQTHGLKDLAEYCVSREVSLFIDETFIDFLLPNTSIWNAYQENPHIVIIRSLTKFYSLPGLRIGYGILSPEKLETISLHQNTWSVNALAQFVGSEVLMDKDFKDQTRAWLDTEKKFMLEELNQFSEVKTFPSETNFILFKLHNSNPDLAYKLFNHLLLGGILIRNCGTFTGLDESYFRVSIRNRKDNQKFIHSFKDFFNKTNP